MSDFEDDLENWQQPAEPPPDDPDPLSHDSRLSGWLKLFAAMLAEACNWALHTANYSLANPVGSDVFLVDVFGLPPYGALENLTVSSLINGVLGLVAVGVPVVMWYFLITKREILNDPRAFFNDRLAKFISILLIVLYAFVVLTEFSALWLRILDETDTGPLPSVSGESVGTAPMVIMSICLIVANAGIGLAVASIYRSLNKTRS